MAPDDLADAAREMRGGGVVIIPTDTVYGLAAAADHTAAVEAMFALKHRPVDVKIAVLVADIDQARNFVDLGPVGEALAARYWPGPLTIVAPRHVPGSLAAGDGPRPGAASTVVSVLETPPVVLRPGPVSAADIEAIAGLDS